MKKLKKFSLLFVAAIALLACPKVFAADFALPQTRPQANQTFTFDYSFKLRLGELVKNNDGNYTVPIIGYQTTEYSTELDLTGNDEIHYKVSEITEEEYNSLKKHQDEIDTLADNATADIVEGYKTNKPSAITDFETIIRNGKDSDKNPWWCYNSYKVGEINLEENCETKYYIVTVDATDINTTEMSSLNWNYHTARVYKVDANTELEACKPTEDTTKEENPKTGISTPYIICGALVLGSIIAFVVSKKEKFL